MPVWNWTNGFGDFINQNTPPPPAPPPGPTDPGYNPDNLYSGVDPQTGQPITFRNEEDLRTWANQRFRNPVTGEVDPLLMDNLIQQFSLAGAQQDTEYQGSLERAEINRQAPQLRGELLGTLASRGLGESTMISGAGSGAMSELDRAIQSQLTEQLGQQKDFIAGLKERGLAAQSEYSKARRELNAQNSPLSTLGKMTGIARNIYGLGFGG